MELGGDGAKTAGYVYVNGTRLAKQNIESTASKVVWHHPNAGSNSWIETGTGRIPDRQEMDPDNAEVGTNDPWVGVIERPTYQSVIKREEPLFIDGGNPFDYSSGFQLNGMPVSRAQLEHMMDTGAAGGGLSIGGRDGGFLDFTGHGAMGLSFVNGEFGSIQIGFGTKWIEDDGSKLGDAVDDPANGIVRINHNNDGLGHWQYTYRDVSFGGQYQTQANHAGPNSQNTNETRSVKVENGEPVATENSTTECFAQLKYRPTNFTNSPL
jgi:hypothetical protein